MMQQQASESCLLHHGSLKAGLCAHSVPPQCMLMHTNHPSITNIPSIVLGGVREVLYLAFP